MTKLSRLIRNFEKQKHSQQVAGALAVGMYAKSKACIWANKTVSTGLKEYSVIYTDRAVNMLSEPFIKAMQKISVTMKLVYKAEGVALIPGSGTYAMESCARQFGTGKRILIIRNGYFSFRWTDILDTIKISDDVTVLKAKPTGKGGDNTPCFAPPSIEEVVNAIKTQKPDVVFAPHVETSTGIILSDDYITKVAQAAHDVGALFVLDCVASGTYKTSHSVTSRLKPTITGTVWVDMKKTGVDAIVSAPQKGWTGPACCGLVMLSKRAEDRIHDDKAQPSSNSFCCNLAKWLNVMESYEDGKAKYYTTLPTDSLMAWSNVLSETRDFGFDLSKSRIFELGGKIRKVLEENGFSSVADDSCKAPGVVVSYSPYEGMYAKFKEQGLQVAGGVPFKLGEKVDPPKQCFRIGLFGLDKNKNVDRTVATFEKALKKIVAAEKKK